MKTVLKFPLGAANITRIKMPKGSNILSVQLHEGTPHIWALVDTEAKQMEMRTIAIFETGKPLFKDAKRYIGTFQIPTPLSRTDYVAHVFELE